jgi:hypothetical protein
MFDTLRLWRRPVGQTLAVALIPLAVLAAPATGQRPDFRFDQPNGTIALFGGWSMPSEGSDLFDFAREELTVERGDFAGPLLGIEAAYRLMDWLDVVAGVEGMRAESRSEFRDWVDMDDLPIEQTNAFSWTRATASAKVYPLARGRTVGSHAWIPGRWAPFVGGGGGIAWYSFQQDGDFVDFDTLEVFRDLFRTTGTGASGHILAGLEISLSRQLVLRGEHRYYWGSAPVASSDFSGFDPIDLAGHRTTIGIATRF